MRWRVSSIKLLFLCTLLLALDACQQPARFQAAAAAAEGPAPSQVVPGGLSAGADLHLVVIAGLDTASRVYATRGSSPRVTFAPTARSSFRGPSIAREPGIYNHRLELWIPGSPHAAKFTQAA